MYVSTYVKLKGIWEFRWIHSPHSPQDHSAPEFFFKRHNYDKTLNTEQPTEKEPQQEIKTTSEEVQIEKSAAPEQEKEKKASVIKSAARSTNKIGPTKLGAIQEEAILKK